MKMLRGKSFQSSPDAAAAHRATVSLQVFHSVTHLCLRNYTLLSVTALRFACRYSCSTAATRLGNMLAECCFHMLYLNNSWTTLLWMSGVPPHGVLALSTLSPGNWQWRGCFSYNLCYIFSSTLRKTEQTDAIKDTSATVCVESQPKSLQLI